MSNPRPPLLYLIVLFLLPLPPSLFLWDPIIFRRSVSRTKRTAELPLRFRHDGAFKIVQVSISFLLYPPSFSPLCLYPDSLSISRSSEVADMHYGNGAATRCRDVPAAESAGCSDMNTTQFLWRLIRDENPDLIVFTGDNIFGDSATDAAESLFIAFGPVLHSGKPWAAVLGNHDQESTMNREELMSLISLMDYSVSRVSPLAMPNKEQRVEGYGNYDLTVHGAYGSVFANTSVLNLYFLDSGDRAVVNGFKTYGWIKQSQLNWIISTSQSHQGIFKAPAPALVFFHIPVPEVREISYTKVVGHYQEAVTCSNFNSGALKTFVSMGNVKAAFMGHDHLNDFCGHNAGIWFCYGGGFGYHAYGRASWPRRARVISAELKKGTNEWLSVESIRTWKRLDDEKLGKIDDQMLWVNS